MDKRFWSVAVIVVTVVVAGAGALPALLLRPATFEAPPVQRPAPSAMPAPKAGDPAPVVTVAHAVAKPAGPLPQAPQPESVPPQASAPQPAAVVSPASPVPPAPVAFPPVQPIGIATRQDLDAAPTQPRVASANPEEAKPKGQQAVRGPRVAAQDTKKRKRPVRPAVYPLREFLAWRR